MLGERWRGHIGATFLAQLTIVALANAIVHGTRPMVTYRALDLGAGPFEVGLVAAVFSIAPAFLAVGIGRTVDRLGETRFVMAAMVAMAAGGLIAAGAGTLLLLAVAQMVMGLGHVTNVIAGQALIANRGPADRRDHRFGNYAMMASLGQLIGPLLAVLLIDRAAIAGPEPNAQAPVFLAATLGAVLALLLSLALPRGHLRKPAAPAEGETRALGFVAAVVSVMGRPGMPFAMMVSMVVISSVDILIMYLPLYGEARNLSVALVGSLLAIRAASSFVSRLFMGRMIDRLGRSGVLALSMAIAGAGLVTIALTDSPVILGTAMVFVGLGLGLGQPMTMAWVASRAPEGERATALAVRLTGNRVALVTTPIVVGAAAGIAGVSVAFWILAAMLGGSALAAIVRPLQSSGGGVQRVSVEVDDQDRA